MLKRRTYGRIVFRGKKIASYILLLIMAVSFAVSFSPFWLKPARAAAITWDGGGGDSDWCTANNWNPNGVPTSADDVTVQSDGVLSITTTGCGGTSINFNSLSIGNGAASNTLTLTTNIGTGGSINIKNLGYLVQDNNTTQTITGTLTVENGGTLKHSDNGTTASYKVDFQANIININSGGTVLSDSLGFNGGTSTADGSGPVGGVGVYDATGGDGSGGAHGSGGGATLVGTNGGTNYCDTYSPSTLGAGGGGANGASGGAGGGFVKLQGTTSITVAGTITADGEGGGTGGAGKHAGGGAGGGVHLFAPTVTLSAGSTISADGGNSPGAPSEGGGGGGGCVMVGYSSAFTNSGTITVAGGTGAHNGGTGTSNSNALPTVSSITPVQISANIVSTTVTITDLDLNSTSLIVEHSTDGSTWASSTLANVTPSEGAVTTSTGNIAGIDTNLDGSVNLTIEWNANVDVANTDDTSVYLRFVPSDTITNGSTNTTAAFSVDTKSPTAPGALTVNSTSTASATLNFGSATVDTNFLEYKVFYSTSTPVTTSNSSLTSSTDANLGVISFNGASTTTLSSLTTNTLYYANIWAYDTWNRSSYAASEINFYTLTGNPTGLATTTVGMTSAAFTVDAINNSTAGSSGYFYDLLDAAATVTTTGWTTTRTWSVTGLSVNTYYVVEVNYRNGDGIGATTSTLDFYTDTSVPAGVSAVADSKTQVTVSWTGDGTKYYVENTTAGTNSGWITATSYAFTNLTAGTQYSFRVKAKNKGDEVIVGRATETSWSSTVFATTQSEGGGGVPKNPGGGGGDPPPPQCEGQDCQPKKPTGQVGGYVLINDDAEKTTSVNVNLNLYFTKFVSTYALIEAIGANCDFSGKPFEDIGASNVFNENYNIKVMPFALSAGLGTKKICVKYRGSLDGGKSFVDYSASDTIILAEVGEPLPPVPEPDKPPQEPPVPANPPEQPPQEPAVPPLPPTEPPAQPPAGPPSNPQPEGPTGGGEPVGQPSQPGGINPVGGTSDNAPSLPVKSAAASVVETAEIIKVVAVEPIVKATKVAVKAVRNVVDNPKVEKTNEVAVAPAIVVAGAANVAVGFNITQILLFLRYIFSQPLLLLRLRKRKSWGVVYNALNKMPVDLATVRLIEESTGRIVQSHVTDAQGRYLITTEPGEYHLEIDKAGFSGFSKLLQDKDEDAKFIHLYHGGKFQVTDAESVLNYNVPLDPTDEAKDNKLIIHEYTKRATQNVICTIGLIASIASFIISPKAIIFVFVLLHFFFFRLFYRFSHRKVTAGSFGTVSELIMEEPIGKVVVRVFDSLYNKLVDTAVTDHKGRYAVLVGPSRYYITYEKDGFEKKQSDVLDFSSEKTQGMGGLINRDEELRREAKML